MNKIYLILTSVVASLGFFSCTEDVDDAMIADNGNREIRFAANTEFSRVTDITTNNLTSFNVYAYTGKSVATNLFMDNVTVTKTANNVWTYSPVRYWPSKQDVDFYAFAPASWMGSSTPLHPVPYSTTNGQEDIVYAVNMNMMGNTGQANAQVIFNFRHALSKMTLKLSSSNTDLKVMVTDVTLANLDSKGNFNFPAESTSGQPSATTIGSWTDQNTPVAYTMFRAALASGRMQLTSTPSVMQPVAPALGSTLYLIPQPLTYRSNGDGQDNYISVMCSIYDAKTNTKLWPNSHTPAENIVAGSTFGDGLLKFPLSTSKFSEWQPGCHYIYNLVINSNDEMGAIEFGTPTVDSFIEVETNYQ